VIICNDCYVKRKEGEIHTRWCSKCGHEQQLNGVEIYIHKRATCEECGLSAEGYYWKRIAPEKQIDAPPQPTELLVKMYCPNCGTIRGMEVSRIKNEMNSRCKACEKSHPANEWLTAPTAPKPTNGNGHPDPSVNIYRSTTTEPAPWEIETPRCECGRLLMPNDVKLGYTKCKGCETIPATPGLFADEPSVKVLQMKNEGYQITADDLMERFAEIVSLCTVDPQLLAELDASLDDIEAELFQETTAELQHAATGQGL
jgi:hypothetical protein